MSGEKREKREGKIRKKRVQERKKKEIHMRMRQGLSEGWGDLEDVCPEGIEKDRTIRNEQVRQTFTPHNGTNEQMNGKKNSNRDDSQAGGGMPVASQLNSRSLFLLS